MTTLERIKECCRLKKNISITTLEQELGYSNGSLSKAKDIPGSRILEISKFLGVSMEYLMTGNDNRFSDENADLVADIMLDNNLLEMMKLYQRLSKEKRKSIMDLMIVINDEKEW